jgi:DNA-binding NarL/FixJ family response regulator
MFDIEPARASAAFRRRWLTAARGEWRNHRSSRPTGITRLTALAPHTQPAEQLTPRQREVALLIARGLTNRQIAERLIIAPRTADNHVQHIFDKLGLSTRAQVAAWVALQGMLAA